MRSALLLATLLSLSAGLSAQVAAGRYGFLVNGIGSFCGTTPTCTPTALPVKAGDPVTATIRAPLGSFYVIGVAPGTGLCQPIPGVENRLVLAGPITIASAGIVNTPEPILACWGARTEFQTTVPLGAPKGMKFGTQAAVFMANSKGVPSFILSNGIEITIQ